MTDIESPFKPGRRIDIPSVPNLRDIGGYALGGGGRVRAGQLYRSVELNHLQGEDLERFANLGLRTVFDLRTAAERSAEPDVVPEGTERIVCDVLADSQSAAPAQLLRVLADPALAEQMLGGGKAVALFERGYREIVSLPSALSA
jgi:protein-tyrosine phosphatase